MLTHWLWTTVWLNGELHERNMTEKLVKQDFGGKECEYTSLGRRIKICVSHVNVHQKGTSAKEDFNSPMNSVIHSEY